MLVGGLFFSLPRSSFEVLDGGGLGSEVEFHYFKWRNVIPTVNLKKARGRASFAQFFLASLFSCSLAARNGTYYTFANLITGVRWWRDCICS